MDAMDIALAVIFSSMGAAVGGWILRRIFGWTLSKFVTAVQDAVRPMLDEVRCELERLRHANHEEHEEIRDQLQKGRERFERIEGKIEGLHDRQEEK